MPIVRETFQEYAARHGGNPLEIGQRLIFPDGAACALDDTVRYEPPSAAAGLNSQRLYFFKKLKLAELDFVNARSEFSERARLAARYANVPGPPENAADILRDLKAAVDAARTELQVIDDQLADSPSARRERERQASLQAQRNRFGGQLAEINSINL